MSLFEEEECHLQPPADPRLYDSVLNRFTSPGAKDGSDLVCIQHNIFKQMEENRLAFSLTSKYDVVGLSLGYKIRETEVQNFTLCM